MTMRTILMTAVSVMLLSSVASANQEDSAALCAKAVYGRDLRALPTPAPGIRADSYSRGRSTPVPGTDFDRFVADAIDRVTTSPAERAANDRSLKRQRFTACLRDVRAYPGNVAGLALQVCQRHFHGNQDNRNACYSEGMHRLPGTPESNGFYGACPNLRASMLADCRMTRFQNLNMRLQPEPAGQSRGRPAVR